MELAFVFDLVDVAIYAALGIILMIFGNFLIDLIVPCHFPTEIKKGNLAVGWLSAGSFIGIAIILRSAIMSPVAEVLKGDILSGMMSSVLYFIVGVAIFMLGYLVVNAMNRRYNLNDEIGKGNTAAGVMVFGIFVGLAIVISGAIV